MAMMVLRLLFARPVSLQVIQKFFRNIGLHYRAMKLLTTDQRCELIAMLMAGKPCPQFFAKRVPGRDKEDRERRATEWWRTGGGAFPAISPSNKAMRQATRAMIATKAMQKGALNAKAANEDAELKNHFRRASLRDAHRLQLIG